MRTFSYDFRLHDKDGGHTIRTAISENPHSTRELLVSVFYTTGVIADRSFTFSNRLNVKMGSAE